MKKKYLITGGLGFIGKAITQSLVKNNNSVDLKNLFAIFSRNAEQLHSNSFTCSEIFFISKIFFIIGIK